MALDRQRILGELGSVMKQLQSADCGCLGKLFGNSQQASPPVMGSPLPTCGGCRRACCHGHGYNQYNSPASMNQPVSNLNYMPTDCPNPSQDPISGNMYGFGPQIVNMMRGDHSKPQNMVGNAQGQLTHPMVIDAPQSPHGKVALTPFTPPSIVPQGQFNPKMNQGDVAGQLRNQFVPESNMMKGNNTNVSQWAHQNNIPNSAAQQMPTPQMNPWSQQNTASNAAPHHISNPHGQHSQGIAKFNKMFPGVKQGLGGDLGFDPMAIAIQMNPDNHLQSAMDTMNKIMDGNKGMDTMVNKSPVPQPGAVGNTLNQNSPVPNGVIQQNVVSDQVAQNHISQVPNQTTGHLIPTQGSLKQQYTNSNAYAQLMPQQNQQIYATALDPNAVYPQTHDETRPTGQQYQRQQIMDLSSGAPNLPLIQQEEMLKDHLEASALESSGYPNQVPAHQIIKEPILPVDTSKNLINNNPSKQKNSYGYNTLGQPVQMLPAKLYHPPEPSLPQTLSPQPDPVKSRTDPIVAVNVKATVSKTSLMGSKPVGKTPSRAQLQHIYNQYKGSQSFTQQNVRRGGEGTFSDARLNVPQTIKTPSVPVERVGGDTFVNNPSNDQNQANKIEHVMGQIGDVAAAKPTSDSLPLKDAPVPIRKCRNGLQDMVFSSYPTSAAWTFHGHGRNDNSPTRHFQHKRY